MAVFAGSQTAYQALRDGSVGSFWNPRVLSSLWQDTAGTIPATVNSEVKRMDDLGPLGNHMLALSGSLLRSGHTYVLKGPILRKNRNQYYLEFDGNGSALITQNASGAWPAVTGNNSVGMTLCVAFYTNSPQPALPSSGFGGTWLGTDSAGNFGNTWFFAARLSTEFMFYCTKRNTENTAWITLWNEGDRYSNINTSVYYNTPLIYTVEGTILNTTFGGREWINGVQTANFSGIGFTDTSLLPVSFNNTLVIGARSPTNDNWIAGRFYGGAIIAKAVTDEERKIIENSLYINCFV